MVFLKNLLLPMLSFIIAFPSLGMEIIEDQSEKHDPAFEPLPMLEFFDHLGGRISFVAYSPDGSMIMTVSHENSDQRFFAAVWDSQSGERLYTIKHNRELFCAKFSSDSSKIFTASYDGIATIRNARNGSGEIKFEHENLVRADISYDGKKVVTSAVDNPLKIWDAEEGKVVIELQKPDSFYQIYFSPNDNKLIATTWHQLFVIDTENDKVSCLETHGGVVEAHSCTHKQLIICDHLVMKLVDIEGGKFLSTLDKYPESIGNEWNCFEFLNINGSNKVVAISFAYSDKTSAGPKALRRLKGPILPRYKSDNKGLSFATPSSDGQLLITASCNNIARIWHVPNGTLLCSIIGFTTHNAKNELKGDIKKANFSPNNRTIITGHKNGMVRVYLMPSDEMLAYQNGKNEKLRFKLYFDLLRKYVMLSKKTNRKKSYNDFIRFMCKEWKNNNIKKAAINENIIFDNLNLHTQDYLRLLIPNRPEPMKDIIH